MLWYASSQIGYNTDNRKKKKKNLHEKKNWKQVKWKKCFNNKKPSLTINIQNTLVCSGCISTICICICTTSGSSLCHNKTHTEISITTLGRAHVYIFKKKGISKSVNNMQQIPAHNNQA